MTGALGTWMWYHSICMVKSDRDISSAQPELSITDRELFERLGWFTHVRWAFGLFCLLTLMVSWHVLGLRLRSGGGPATMAPAVEVVLCLFLYNAVFTFLVRVVRARRGITRRLIAYIALGQIICDLVAITALMHYTGGVANWFVLLILVPIAIVAELLPRGLAYATACIAVVLLNALAWGELLEVLPHVTVELAGGAPREMPQVYRDPHYVLLVTAALAATIFAMVFVATTIAARLRSREAQLEDAYRRLRRNDEAKSFFMRRAEHDLRAPLAAIQNILDAVALESGGLTEKQIKLLARAKTRTRALRELVSDLRRYARLRIPEGSMARQRVCFSDVVTDTVDLFAPQAETRELQLESTVEPVWVEGNDGLLRELATNLITNALQYTPSGGRVSVTLVAAGRLAALEVSDTGIGISDDARERLFEEFFRAPEATEFFPDGTGLGLAIVKRIVDMHGGRIEADSPSQGGAVFTVRLPTVPAGDLLDGEV